MKTFNIEGMNIELHHGDLPGYISFSNSIVAIDTELNRVLDPFKGKLCLVQVRRFRTGKIYLVKFDVNKPYNAPNLVKLMEDTSSSKLLYFANVDMQFISHHLQCKPNNLLCTRLMSKVMRSQNEGVRHSLINVLDTYLGIKISKDEQCSEWESPNLSLSQIKYAALDVAHLHDLYCKMMFVASNEQRNEIKYRLSNYANIVQEMLNGNPTTDPLYLY